MGVVYQNASDLSGLIYQLPFQIVKEIEYIYSEYKNKDTHENSKSLLTKF